MLREASPFHRPPRLSPASKEGSALPAEVASEGSVREGGITLRRRRGARHAARKR